MVRIIGENGMLKDQLPQVKVALPGPATQALQERRSKANPSSIRCIYPVAMKRAQGAMIEDLDGNLILDWIGGVGVLNIGHCHPEVVEAVKEQSEKYFHGMFNIVTHEGYVELAEKLNAIIPVKGDEKKTFFANSGAEADENAIKLARAYTKRSNVIVFSGAFHGRTYLTMSMTSKKAYARGMGPLPGGIFRAEYPYLYRAEKEMNEAEMLAYYKQKIEKVFEEASPAAEVAAIVLEPLQGEGGFVPAPIAWVKMLRELCDKEGILLIADEVQTGFGRTGRMFATNYWAEAGVYPDIVSTAKSIAGGVPLSAITASAEIMESAPAGTIGGTYGGNALACAAALKVIEIMERDNLAERAQEIGSIVTERYSKWMKENPYIGDIRGLGAMIGIEFVKDKTTKEPYPEMVNYLIQECVSHGLLIENAGTYGNVVRFLAPLVITDEQLEAGLSIFEAAIKKFSDK